MQPILKKIRRAISTAAPEAHELLSYRMPAFRLHGILVYFAAFKNHIGLYPPLGRCEAREGARALCRAERQSQVPARSTNSLRPHQESRALPGEAGPLSSGGEKKEGTGTAAPPSPSPKRGPAPT
ncbi:MAG: iron chaperone [Thermoanaerobaculia bacterium]